MNLSKWLPSGPCGDGRQRLGGESDYEWSQVVSTDDLCESRSGQSSVVDASAIPLDQHVTVLPAQSAWGFSPAARFRHETHDGEIRRQVRLHVLWRVSSKECVTSHRPLLSDHEAARTKLPAVFFTHVRHKTLTVRAHQ